VNCNKTTIHQASYYSVAQTCITLTAIKMSRKVFETQQSKSLTHSLTAALDQQLYSPVKIS